MVVSGGGAGGARVAVPGWWCRVAVPVVVPGGGPGGDAGWRSRWWCRWWCRVVVPGWW
ncbi:hypothetical protein ACFQ40_11660 [Kroppenstedtia eburnea]|uniref:hypothetical protein n=1 Tax=Kroppenstedtia eburnea TaxID=714067 RepID=UPI003633A762